MSGSEYVGLPTEFPQAYDKRKALFLDGMRDADLDRDTVPITISKLLQEAGWDTNTICLRKTRISPCMGEFGCWIRTPGVCIIDDDSQEIARLLIQSDVVVYLTEITFGGFSSELKKALDRSIGNVSPYFEKFEGAVRHKARYERYPRLTVIGLERKRDAEAEKVFRDEVKRVAIDGRFGEPTTYVVVHANEEQPAMSNPDAEVLLREPAEKRKLLLLIGSPKSSKSNSESLGSYLLSRLDDTKFEKLTMYVLPTFCSELRMESLLDEVEACDDLVLSFPLYVDGLPAPVVKFMEEFGARQGDKARRVHSLLAICNSGFPEAEHSYTALDICRLFARDMRMNWMGCLALGGGEGIINEKPLDALPETIAGKIRRSLILTAAALERGDAVPREAIELMAKPSIVTASSRLYMWMGNIGWRQTAKEYGTGKKLEDAPYLESSS